MKFMWWGPCKPWNDLMTDNDLTTNNELSNYSIELSVQIGVSTGPKSKTQEGKWVHLLLISFGLCALYPFFHVKCVSKRMKRMVPYFFLFFLLTQQQ